MQAIKVAAAVKGANHNGQPLCFDVSPDKQLLAVGFEDDSFIAFHFEVKDQGTSVETVPVVRGLGHRNFLNSLRFDASFYNKHLQFLHESTGVDTSRNSGEIQDTSEIDSEHKLAKEVHNIKKQLNALKGVESDEKRASVLGERKVS